MTKLFFTTWNFHNESTLRQITLWGFNLQKILHKCCQNNKVLNLEEKVTKKFQKMPKRELCGVKMYSVVALNRCNEVNDNFHENIFCVN